MLNKKKILNFWNMQATKINRLGIEGVANLEENPNLLEKKILLESKKVFEYLDFKNNDNLILDLGAGTCQWSLKFSEYAKKIIAVEFSKNMIDIGKKSAKNKNINNIDFVYSEAQKYYEPILFDYIFISGLIIYLNDSDLSMMLNNLKKMSKTNTIVLVRDGTGIFGRYEIRDKFSKDLNLLYSATYRSEEEYVEFFKTYGFSLEKKSNMFPEDSDLNKWTETRLKIYRFKYEKI